ncbi:hypothetical protein [Sphingomonas sp. SRS2]|uniref:hypothetical protein n=1 Tax=Sphingomonas sp. SRS2 TaxID=133190 RepID=UPI00128E927A|nr:hypothetical protein [Sphingomonas sp. SRS2]
MNAHTLDDSSPTGSIHHAAVKKCRSMPEYSAAGDKANYRLPASELVLVGFVLAGNPTGKSARRLTAPERPPADLIGKF